MNQINNAQPLAKMNSPFRTFVDDKLRSAGITGEYEIILSIGEGLINVSIRFNDPKDEFLYKLTFGSNAISRWHKQFVFGSVSSLIQR